MMQRITSSNCNSCLSWNRELRPLGSYPGYLAYCVGLGLNDGHQICWECSAALKKYHQFRQRTLSAQRIFKNLKSSVFSEYYTGGCDRTQNLSNLTKVSNNTFNAIFVSIDQLVEPAKLKLEQIFINPESVQIDSDDEAYNTIKEEEIDDDNAMNLEPLEIHIGVKSEGKDTVKGKPVPEETSLHSPLVSEDKKPHRVKRVTSSRGNGVAKKVVRRRKRRVQNSSKVQTRKKRRKAAIIEKKPFVETTESTTKRKLESRDSSTDTASETEPLASASAQEAEPLTSASATVAHRARGADDDDVLTRTLTYEQACEFLCRRRASLTEAKHKVAACIDCAVPFYTYKRHEEHMKLHSPSAGPLKCDICTLRFQDKATLDQHVAQHLRYFECRLCGFEEPSPRLMVAHWRERHLGITCPHCDTVFKKRGEWRAHYKRCHPSGPKVCAVCGKTCRPTNYYSHLETHKHAECTVCKKQIRGGEGKLRKHMKTYHKTDDSEEGVYCVPCDKYFKNKTNYAAHVKTTSAHISDESMLYVCEHCGRRFTLKSSIQNHMEVRHLRLGNYPCAQCDLRFNSSVGRSRHARRRHSAAPRRALVCQLCGKLFSATKTLREHLNMHRGVRPLKCEHCPATFVYSAARYTHTRLVHRRRGRRSKDPPE